MATGMYAGAGKQSGWVQNEDAQQIAWRHNETQHAFEKTHTHTYIHACTCTCTHAHAHTPNLEYNDSLLWGQRLCVPRVVEDEAKDILRRINKLQTLVGRSGHVRPRHLHGTCVCVG